MKHNCGPVWEDYSTIIPGTKVPDFGLSKISGEARWSERHFRYSTHNIIRITVPKTVLKQL